MAPSRYAGESVFLRWWPPGMIVLALVVLTGAGAHGLFFAVAFTTVGLVAARILPWRFDVFDDGIELRFPLGARRFLAKDDIRVAVGLSGAVVRRAGTVRFGYPLTDGFVESRLWLLRAVLTEHGFEVG